MRKSKISSYVGEYWPLFILAPLCTVLETAAELALPFLMGKIVTKGIATQDFAFITKTGSAMVLISLLGLIFGLLGAKISATAAQGFGHNLRDGIFRKIQTFSFADIDNFSTASLVTRCIVDVRQIQEVTMQGVRMLVRAPALLILSMVICINLNAQLSLVYCISVPCLFVVLFLVMRIVRPYFRKLQKRLDALNASVRENLIAIRVVKTFVRATHEKEKFASANDELQNVSINASLRIAMMHPCSTIIFNFATLALYWFGGHFVGNGTMTDGDLLTYIAYLNNILMSVMMFNMVLSRASRAKVCFERCNEILIHTPSIVSPNSATPLEKSNAITFDNVSFSYPTSTSEHPVLSNISFSIKAGEFVAIIGKTGSGKTSLINLLPRFYDPTEGHISLHNTLLTQCDLTALRRKLGMVAQNNMLFSGTIRENLLWGNEYATQDELQQAASHAQALAFIEAMPKSWDTYVEQGGVNLSGGQRQRLCIARALLKKPEILILDDATSALDSATEKKIRDVFYTEYKNATILLIAQRISSVQDADRIFVMDNGKICDIGTHDELLQKNVLYQEIYNSQQEGGGTNGTNS